MQYGMSRLIHSAQVPLLLYYALHPLSDDSHFNIKTIHNHHTHWASLDWIRLMICMLLHRTGRFFYSSIFSTLYFACHWVAKSTRTVTQTEQQAYVSIQQGAQNSGRWQPGFWFSLLSM